MINTNNNAGMDHDALAMLCGVVPPQYREGVKHQFLVPRADVPASFPEEPEEPPRSNEILRISPPPP
jgi:hypothetical protein